MSGLAALMGLLAAIPAAGQDVVQDPPPELSFLSTILKVRKNISYEPWGEVKVALNADGGPFKRGKHWLPGCRRAPAGTSSTWQTRGLVDLAQTWRMCATSRSTGCCSTSTNRPCSLASDAALQPAANLMSTDKALKLEVQGHTDNVGNDAYNETLSEPPQPIPSTSCADF